MLLYFHVVDAAVGVLLWKNGSFGCSKFVSYIGKLAERTAILITQINAMCLLFAIVLLCQCLAVCLWPPRWKKACMMNKGLSCWQCNAATARAERIGCRLSVASVGTGQHLYMTWMTVADQSVGCMFPSTCMKPQFVRPIGRYKVCRQIMFWRPWLLPVHSTCFFRLCLLVARG